MSITEQQFNNLCEEFIKLSDKLGDSWKLETSSANYVLSKEVVKKIDVDSIWVHEYCISYSASYQVPELYFNIHRQDGSLVPFDEFWPIISNNFDCNFSSDCLLDISSIVSQFEHPVYFRPFYKIHPCGTQDLMKTHGRIIGRRYLICWLSSICHLTGLRLSEKYSID